MNVDISSNEKTVEMIVLWQVIDENYNIMCYSIDFRKKTPINHAHNSN